ncbi:MAG: enoyl-CoA hydratase-related protein [Arhodomonas sp.]|nr:enoyl-CoA hydratase-related protein [Arhodomonas sp.]
MPRTRRRLGLVHEVVPAEALDDTVGAMIATLHGNGPLAMREAKRLALDMSRGPLDEHMVEDTAERIADQRASDEGKAGVSAFLEKRPPRWKDG